MTSPQSHAQPVDYLLREVTRLRDENRKLRRRVGWLRESRAEWRRKAEQSPPPARRAKPTPLPPGDPRHGTTNGYSNLGCRCDECREANTARCLAYQHRTGRHRPYAEWLASVEGCHVPHGTESRYTNGGCRCDECKRAAAQARNRRRYETPEKGERQRAYDRERKRASPP